MEDGCWTLQIGSCSWEIRRFPAIQKFGLLTAITIGSALAGDLFIFKALLMRVDRRTLRRSNVDLQ